MSFDWVYRQVAALCLPQQILLHAAGSPTAAFALFCSFDWGFLGGESRDNYTYFRYSISPTHQIFTVAEWYIVPLVWLPIATYIFLRSLFQFSGFILPAFTSNPALPMSSWTDVPAHAMVKVLACFFTGNIIWTFLEYILHRFLFHIDEWLPDMPLFMMLHFLFHGIHHFMPMDKYVVQPV